MIDSKMERQSFIVNQAKRDEWFNCIKAIDNWISNHSMILKKYRLNNGNGIRKCLIKFLSDLDKFMYEQEDLEITID